MCVCVSNLHLYIFFRMIGMKRPNVQAEMLTPGKSPRSTPPKSSGPSTPRKSPRLTHCKIYFIQPHSDNQPTSAYNHHAYITITLKLMEFL